MLWVEAAFCVLRIFGCGVRILRATQAKKGSEEGGSPHSPDLWVSKAKADPFNPGDHRRHVSCRRKDKKQIGPVASICVVRAQVVEGPQQLFRSNGGPAGCAEMLAALRSRTPRGCVRSGGKNLVRKNPLLTEGDLIRPDRLYVKEGRVFRRPDVSDLGNSSATLAKGVRHR